MWQALRNELHPKGFELITVGLDTQGDAGCRASIEAAKPQHPSLIDQHHVLADLFGVTRSTVYRAVERERARAGVIAPDN